MSVHNIIRSPKNGRRRIKDDLLAWLCICLHMCYTTYVAVAWIEGSVMDTLAYNRSFKPFLSLSLLSFIIDALLGRLLLAVIPVECGIACMAAGVLGLRRRMRDRLTRRIAPCQLQLSQFSTSSGLTAFHFLCDR